MSRSHARRPPLRSLGRSRLGPDSTWMVPVTPARVISNGHAAARLPLSWPSAQGVKLPRAGQTFEGSASPVRPVRGLTVGQRHRQADAHDPRRGRDQPRRPYQKRLDHRTPHPVPHGATSTNRGVCPKRRGQEGKVPDRAICFPARTSRWRRRRPEGRRRSRPGRVGQSHEQLLVPAVSV